MSQRVRIKDIAEETGVSIGTVDRVIHNRGHVAPEVRQRVLQAMEKLGYEPNILARMLANNRVFRIAAILPEYSQDPYWVQPKEGAEIAAGAVHHYGVVVEFYFFHQFQAEDFEQKSNHALATQPDALLVAPLFRDKGEALLAQAETQQIPVVTINTYLEGAHCLCYIGQESYQSGVLAGRLVNFGLNDGDQAMVLNLDHAVTNARHLLEKERGFRDFFSSVKEKKVEVISEIYEAFNQPELFKPWICEKLQQYPRLSGIFVTNSRAYKLADVLPPDTTRRLKIVGFDLVQPNLEYLEQDKIRFLINQNAWHQGYLGILAIVNSLILKKEIGSFQFLPLDIVVKENVEYYLKRTLEIPMVAV